MNTSVNIKMIWGLFHINMLMLFEKNCLLLFIYDTINTNLACSLIFMIQKLETVLSVITLNC